MANYAELDASNTVTQVFVGKDETDTSYDWELYYAVRGRTVKRTSYNTIGGVYYDPKTRKPAKDQSKAFRGNYAGIGFTYDETLDAFIPPQPYASWTLDQATYSWVSPVPYPNEGGTYDWNEDGGDWLEVVSGAV